MTQLFDAIVIGDLLSASRIFINVGGRATVPDMRGANPSDRSRN